MLDYRWRTLHRKNCLLLHLRQNDWRFQNIFENFGGQLPIPRLAISHPLMFLVKAVLNESVLFYLPRQM